MLSQMENHSKASFVNSKQNQIRKLTENILQYFSSVLNNNWLFMTNVGGTAVFTSMPPRLFLKKSNTSSVTVGEAR
jgi:hypothetical protein